jgi:hypothetical protein
MIMKPPEEMVTMLTMRERVEELRRLLVKMDHATEGLAHDKKCWFCAQCGDDLFKAIKEVDEVLARLPEQR